MDARRYLVVIERSADGYGAYAPDVPGCGVVGDTREEVEQLIREALELHFESLAEDGLAIPQPISSPVEVEVRLPAAKTGSG